MRVVVQLAVDFDWEPNTVLTPADVATMIVKYGAVELGHKNVKVTVEKDSS